MRPGETPVPIPNTTVKTRAAENTMPETVWKDRRPPASLQHHNKRAGSRLLLESTKLYRRYELKKFILFRLVWLIKPDTYLEN